MTAARTARQWRVRLIELVSEVTGIAPGDLSADLPFADYGLGSVQLVGLAGELEQELGSELPATLAFEYPTLTAVADYLAARDGAGEAGADVEVETDVLVRGPAPRTPVAIVGMACRTPGGVDSADGLWTALLQGMDAVSEVPAERWSTAEWYSEDPDAPGRSTSRFGGFLSDVSGFDADFFGVSAREAGQMDPAQRLLCEVCWDALADAGIPSDALAGSDTGVYVGISNGDHGHLLFQRPQEITPYAGTGGAYSITANRLSYLLDTHGPSIAIDTACSSSLVAVDAACSALDVGLCSTAIVGGVNLTLAPQVTVNFSKAGALAEDGRCKAFDAAADGFVRSEGVGVVVLKPLAAALEQGDRVHAVIRGSAVTQDGRSNGLMAPNLHAQKAVIAQACRAASVEPRDIGYVEAHGTGTPLGDPIEARAVGAVLAAGRDARLPCLIGSIKSNIGHAEGAAGLISLIKAAMVVHHRLVPPSLHFAAPNPEIDFSALLLAVPTKTTPWPSDARAVAGVNSFGFGGTNAHVVLSEPPPPVCTEDEADSAGDAPRPLLVSARTPAALMERLEKTAAMLESPGAPPIGALCSTAAFRTSHHEYRAVAWGSTPGELAAAARRATARATSRAESGDVTFVFSGQGGRWWPIAEDLLSEPVFATTIEACGDALTGLGVGWDLLAILRDDTDVDIDNPEVSQPALCAVQIALAELFRAWGVTPDAVVGHSLGEVAAAQVAGVLSLEAALRVATERGKAITQDSLPGVMLLVNAGVDAVRAVLVGQPHLDRIWIAAVNAPETVVVSGEPEQIPTFQSALAAAGVESLDLGSVRFASHCPLVEPAAASLERSLSTAGGVRGNPATTKILSTSRGKWLTGPEIDTAYWSENLKRTVRFADAIDALAADGSTSFIEISPHVNLVPNIGACLRARGGDTDAVVGLHRDSDVLPQLRAILATLHCAGAAVEWERTVPGRAPVTPLPAYPWQHRDFAVQSSETTPVSSPLGFLTTEADSDRILRSITLSMTSHPFLSEHVVAGHPVVPAAFLLDAMAATPGGRPEDGHTVLRDVRFGSPLIAEESADRVTVQVIASGTDLVAYGRPAAAADDGWQRHCTATLARVRSTVAEAASLAQARRTCTRSEDVPAYYRDLAANGLSYGPRFQGIEQLFRGDLEALGRLRGRRATWHDDPDYPINPIVLDSALQVVAAALPPDLHGTWVPVRCDAFEILGPDPVDVRWAHARTAAGAPADSGTQEPDELVADVALFAGDGSLVVNVWGLRLKSVPDPADAEGTRLYEVAWTPETPTGGRITAEEWIVVGDDGGPAAVVNRVLQSKAAAVRISPPAAPPEFDSRRAAVAYTAGLAVQLDVSGRDGGRAADAAVRDGVMPLLRTVSALAHAAPASVRLVVLTRGGQGTRREPVQAMLGAVARVVRSEHPGWEVVLVDLDQTEPPEELLWAALCAPSGAELALRDGQLQRPVLRELALRTVTTRQPWRPVSGRGYRLATATLGVLDSLRPLGTPRAALEPDAVEISVSAAGINFADVLKALGRYPGAGSDPLLGGECSGIVSRVGESVTSFAAGDRVLAAAGSALGAYALSREQLTVRLPAEVDMVSAAGLPLTFLTARYCLEALAHVAPGETVLIHSGTGGVGRAALEVARERGAVVLATAGSPKRRDLLAGLPGVAAVFDSRTVEFADQARAATGGRGVDVVLNSLSGARLRAGLGLLAPGGRFVEIGKADIYGDRSIGLGLLRENRSLLTFDLEHLLRDQPDVVSAWLRDTVERVAEGIYRVPPTTAHPVAEAARAFVEMARARHDGKLVIDFTRPPATVEWRTPLPLSREPGTYLITGGLGALGRALVEPLLASGAAHVVLAGRGAPDATIVDWLSAPPLQGRVTVSACDVADARALDELMERIRRELPPLRGIIHAAGTLADAPAVSLTKQQVSAAVTPKLGGAVNLLAAADTAGADFVVLVSSATAVLGLAGQSAYAAANAALDALATLHDGRLRVVSLGFGPLAVGGLAAAMNQTGTLDRLGIGLLSTERVTQAIANALQPPDARTAVDLLALNARPDAVAEGVAAGILPTILAGIGGVREQDAGAGEALRAELLSIQPGPRRRRRLLDHCLEQAALVLQRDAASIPPDAPIASLGFDSLMSLELGRRLETSTGAEVPSTVVWRHPTVAALVTYLGEAMQIPLDPAQGPPQVVPEPAAAIDARPEDALAGLSDAEAAQELLRVLDEISSD